MAVIPVGLTPADRSALIDLWIAASCLEQGALLCSLEAQFEAVPGLRHPS